MDVMESGAKAVPEQDMELSVDASYTLEYREEGVYLVVSYEQGSGTPLIPELVAYDMIRRGVSNQSLIILLTRFKKRDNLIRLADAKTETKADADLAVKLSRDEMAATMMLFPPVAGGDDLTFEAALAQLREKWRVVYGLDEEAVARAIADQQYYTPLIVARGREPVKGQDGDVTIMFKTVHSHAPRILEDGSADYRNLDIFESTAENDLLAVISPPEDGIEGMTVTGKTLSAPKGKPAKMPKGKNTWLSDDGLKLYAAKSGRVDYTAGRIEVSNVLRIVGDVGMGIGNIDFLGDIEIKGNVISNLTVTATGNIEIAGNVEAASIIAGKNIVLKSGIQGMDKGELQAGGNITARFIEKTKAHARGSLYSDYIAHSTVSALGQVSLSGRHGKIIGSVVRSGKEVIARYIGASSLIEIGVSPEVRAHLALLEDKCSKTKAQLEKIEGILGTIPAESQDGTPLHLKLVQAREQLESENDDCVVEIGMLRTVLAERSGGKIHVTGLIEQDVRLIIDSVQYLVKSSVEFATFRYHNGEILFGPCEKTAK